MVQEINDISVKGIGLPKRLVNTLRAGDVDTIGDLLEVGSAQLLRWRNVNKATIRAINYALKEYELNI